LDFTNSEKRDEDGVQNHPQPCEDEPQVIADGAEDGVGGIAGAAFEIAATEMAFGLHVTDHGLDGGAASKLSLDGAEHTALLT
jgi:hypothetical protein